METTVTFENGAYAVRTDTGIFYGDFETQEAAISYASGLVDGYNAARARLDRAKPFRVNWAELARAANA